MTILTVKNALLTHFLSHDTFDFSRHAMEIPFDKDVSGFREDMIRAAFDEIEKLGIAKKMTAEDTAKDIWVLVQPLTAYQQQVTVGPLVASIIGDVINHYNEVDQLDGRCDKSQIDEGDILRLVQIIQNYESMLEDEDDAETSGADEEERE